MAELTKGQQNALNLLIKWYSAVDSEQVFRVFGYAGVGKSYSINAFIKSMGLELSDVKFATYTGKAALVLCKKGIAATTIHKLIYTPVEEVIEKEQPDGTIKKITKIRFIKKPELDLRVKLIVIDECSMVGEKLWEDLLSFKRPIIVLGDPGQLPPIEGKSPILDVKPDAFLDEIVRQASGNPIIHLSMLARQGKPINFGSYGDNVNVIRMDEMPDEVLLDSDIMLVATNQVRDELNTYIRKELFGRDSVMPMVGDKLICRKNNWEKVLNGIPLVNGLIGEVVNPIRYEAGSSDKTFMMDFRPDGFKNLYFDDLECNIDMFNPANTANKRKEIASNRYSKGDMFEYGNAITIHLSQGSQWNNVGIYYVPFGDAEFRRKLLYTAITRAESKLTLIK